MQGGTEGGRIEVALQLQALAQRHDVADGGLRAGREGGRALAQGQ
jgi:hypothetical protein